MKMTIGAKLRISNPSKALHEWCREHLVIDNPDYYKKVQMGKWTGNTPSKIYLYERLGNEVLLPFGCLRDVWREFSKDIEYDVHINPIRSFDYSSAIELYSYQEKAVSEALKAKNGILVMPCGSGKTQSGLEVIARVGGRALWLTHTQDLLNQSKKRAESVLGNVGCGTITEGRINIGGGITFATVQTLCKVDLAPYTDYWDVIIVDECQHCAGSPTRVTQFYKVMSNLCARYKIGLTATPYRSDGLEKSMFALLGDIIYEVDKEEVASKTCPVIVEQIQTGWFPKDDVTMGDGTIDYAKVVDSLIHDEDRFELVLDTIVNLPKGEPVIVLGSRVEYLQRLRGYYDKRRGGFEPSICLSGLGTSQSAKKLRKNALLALNNGEIDCLFATYQLAKEGLDVPNLRYIVFATPERDETTIIQSVGRVGRKAESKDFGTVIDFVDDFGMYKGWSKKRVSYYKKIGAKLC